MTYIYEVNTLVGNDIESNFTADTREYAEWMLKAKMQEKNFISKRVHLEPMCCVQAGNGIVGVYLPSPQGMYYAGEIERETLEYLLGEDIALEEMTPIPFMTEYVERAIKERNGEGKFLSLVV